MRVLPHATSANVPDCVIAGASAKRDCDADGHDRWARSVADLLDENRPVVLRLGRLRWDKHRTFALATRVVEQLCIELAARTGLDLQLEIDSQDDTDVPPGSSARSRLPHADGQHSTYMTPSTERVPSFPPAMRTFAEAGHTSAAHKVYAGFFVEDAGHGLSLTTFSAPSR